MAPGARSRRADADPSDSSDPRSWPVRRAESFGGVVVRTGDAGHEVALIRVRSLKGREAWTLPKGTAEEGETPETTALREVREETGIEAEIIEPLEDITYWFVYAPERARYRKTVHYYLMRATGGDLTQHDAEVEEVRFVPIAQAPRLATYSSDRKVLKGLADVTAKW